MLRIGNIRQILSRFTSSITFGRMGNKFDMDEDYTSREALNLYSYNSNPLSSGWEKLSLPSKAVAAVPTVIRVISWNVDFMADYAEHRLKCVLDHLQNTVIQESEITTCPPSILLQEVQDDVLPVLLEHTWVRDNFNISPISNEDWHQNRTYGSVTLVHKNIPVSSVFKIAFEKSVMGRFALFVDLELGNPAAATGAANDAAEKDSSGKQNTVLFRLASVHLESLPDGARARPRQLRAVASALEEEGCFGGMVCGDMNAIQESDRNTPAEVGLLDAFQGDDDDPASHTWGYQPTCRFAPGRLDKILYTPPSDASSSSPQACFSVDAPALVGVDLRAIAPRRSGKSIEVWASDHYGLSTTLSIKCK